MSTQCSDINSADNSTTSSPAVNKPNVNIASKDLSFIKALRLLNAADYSNVFDHAPFRASTAQFLLLSRPNHLSHPRLGLIVAKKHVKKACKRNRIKRYTRESFRLKQHNIPPIDAIVLARKGADKLSDKELTKMLNNLWVRIAKKAAKKPTTHV